MVAGSFPIRNRTARCENPGSEDRPGRIRFRRLGKEFDSKSGFQDGLLAKAKSGMRGIY
jgi:hypothetical protein